MKKRNNSEKEYLTFFEKALNSQGKIFKRNIILRNKLKGIYYLGNKSLFTI